MYILLLLLSFNYSSQITEYNIDTNIYILQAEAELDQIFVEYQFYYIVRKSIESNFEDNYDFIRNFRSLMKDNKILEIFKIVFSDFLDKISNRNPKLEKWINFKNSLYENNAKKYKRIMESFAMKFDEKTEEKAKSKEGVLPLNIFAWISKALVDVLDDEDIQLIYGLLIIFESVRLNINITQQSKNHRESFLFHIGVETNDERMKLVFNQNIYIDNFLRLKAELAKSSKNDNNITILSNFSVTLIAEITYELIVFFKFRCNYIPLFSDYIIEIMTLKTFRFVKKNFLGPFAKFRQENPFNFIKYNINLYSNICKSELDHFWDVIEINLNNAICTEKYDDFMQKITLTIGNIFGFIVFMTLHSIHRISVPNSEISINFFKQMSQLDDITFRSLLKTKKFKNYIPGDLLVNTKVLLFEMISDKYENDKENASINPALDNFIFNTCRIFIIYRVINLF